MHPSLLLELLTPFSGIVLAFWKFFFLSQSLTRQNFDRPIRNVGERSHFPCCTIPVALLLVALVELLVASSSELLLLRQPKLFRQESEYV